MKKVILATAVSFASVMVSAEPFEFEKALGSPDLDPSLGNPGVEFPQIARPGPEVTSLDHIYRGNPDGTREERHWEGDFVPSAPFAISLYEIYRGNPDGSGYQGYYERYPANTDWERLGREHRRELANDRRIAQR